MGDPLTQRQHRVLQTIERFLHDEGYTPSVREIGGGEFLVAACGGVLDDRVLSPAGIDFARRHYGAFEDFIRETLPAPVEDKWAHYDRVAPWLTARYLGRSPRKRRFEWRPWKWRR